MKQFKVKYTNVPFLGYTDKYSSILGERLLHLVATSTWDTPLQLLNRGDILSAVDVVWSPTKNELYGRYRTKDGVLVCIPYAKLDELLEELQDG